MTISATTRSCCVAYHINTKHLRAQRLEALVNKCVECPATACRETDELSQATRLLHMQCICHFYLYYYSIMKTTILDSILFEVVDHALLADIATTEAIRNARVMLNQLDYKSMVNLSEAIFDNDLDTAKCILSSVGLQ